MTSSNFRDRGYYGAIIFQNGGQTTMSKKEPPIFFKILRHPLNNIRSQTALRSMCRGEVTRLLQY